ncbi:cupin domain-containing protein [Aeromonas dhakensis]|uniref:cupin domain-containing protein n=1 Tax=Aeromonas dhakensis TaxID=196024 RepID=UPI00280F5632|nr:cupin domain-containing protein [Aeromonas hydrophila]
MMKNFSTEIGAAKLDETVGIAIATLARGRNLTSFGTRMQAGKKVSCHSHSDGEEWYIILSGKGRIFLADEDKGTLSNQHTHFVTGGDVFCIHTHTAHQLLADTDLDLIFLCPESHLSTDRLMFDDLC